MPAVLPNSLLTIDAVPDLMTWVEICTELEQHVATTNRFPYHY